MVMEELSIFPSGNGGGGGGAPPLRRHDHMDGSGRAAVLNGEVLARGKKYSKAPRIKGLVTPLNLQRKRAMITEKKKKTRKSKADVAEYQKLLALCLKEQRERRSESLAKGRFRLSATSKPSATA